MRKYSKFRDEKGYSLVEVMVGLLIFSVGALASGAMIMASLHQNQAARAKSQAASLVTQRLEELRSRPWFDAGGGASLVAGGDILSDEDLRTTSLPSTDANFSETINSDGTGAADLASQDTFYLVMWRIEDLADSGMDFKRIVIKGVAMSWHRGQHMWEPISSFDHVTMIFREIKVE